MQVGRRGHKGSRHDQARWHLVLPFYQQGDRVRNVKAFAQGNSLVKGKLRLGENCPTQPPASPGHRKV